MKKFLSLILSLAVIITCFPAHVLAVETPSTYGKIITSSTTYTAQADENIKVSGEGVIAEITLSGVAINKSSEISVSAIRIENGATVHLTVLGTNTLRGAEGCAGISVDETSTLIITDASTGTLNSYGGLMAAGIGSDAECNSGTITINNGTINAYGGDNAGQFADDRGGAGIGGGNNGSGGCITINDGNIYADGGSTSAGIGGGNNGGTGTITINSGTIRASAGYQGAAIGGVGGSIEINGGDITANGWAYGAAIGCSHTYEGGGTNITINGGTINAESSSFCAAIGGSMGDNAGDILITGGTIVAEGEESGIGKAKSVTITGGNITATAEAGGTGIQGTVTISGGVINATGGSDGAGIGGTSGAVTISGGTITAKGGYNAAGIGGDSGVGGCTIVITGGSIKAVPGSENADAIGSGANGTSSSVTNGVGNGLQQVHLVAVQNAVNAEGTKYANLTITANQSNTNYEYKYSGYGHENDELLYFYLPDEYTLPDGLVEYDTSLLDGYDIHIFENTSYIAETDKNIKVSGEGVIANITLSGVTINKSSEVSVSAIRIENGATVYLTVLGTNTLRGADGCAGISVDETSTLIITELSTGALNAYGGLMAAGIGGDAECNNGTVTIHNGTIYAKGGENAGQFADDRGGAGIGGGNNGDGGIITINGGNISATGGDASAGIGAGRYGNTGVIVINGGTINASSGYKGAAIGGIDGSITINGGTITANEWAYAAGIGGSDHGYCGDITINGGTINAFGDETAIGLSDSVLITGGEITAKGDGMTGGSEGIGHTSSVKITGGKIIAIGNASATAIESSNIVIENGIIDATGGSDGAGIGGRNGTITISGGTITAKGGYNGAGIGGESGVGGCTIVITGGSVKATAGSSDAEDIGSGANGQASTVTNGDSNGNKALHLVAVQNAVSKNNDKKADVYISAGSSPNQYAYQYIGYGHTNDEILYVYLPDEYQLPEGLSEYDISLLDGYDVHIFESATYTAQADENIKVSGEGVIAEITLSGVAINKSSEISVSAIRIENGATVHLTVLGANTLRGAEGCAGISVDESSTLIITDASTGTLNSYGGLMASGIGGDAECNSGTITINNGTINAYGGENAGAFADERGGAGIGGGNNGSGGNITINGGSIYADGGDTSAGIGGGNDGATGTIVINDGTVRASAGYEGAAIGGIGGSVEINGGNVTANGWAYGAAIGCPATGGGIKITINGGNINAESSSFCAAIGGSWGATSGDILITGGTITADGESCGIGDAPSVTISGGTITTTADAGGTGIMSRNITISGGVIDATGGSDGAGIGGTSGTVTISGGTITAKGGYNAAGIGGDSGVGGCTIIITGGSIKAVPGSENAEAVGSGANGATSSVTNGVENGNQPLTLVAIENAVESDNTKLANVVVDAGDAANGYEYLYTGYGHPNDSLLYFYLPENHTVHVWDEGEVTKEPTCTETGNKTYTCSCGEVEIEIIPALGHHVAIPGKEMVDSYTLVNDSNAPFSFADGWYSSTNKSHSSTSVFEIRATYDCTLVLQYKVSSESGYDKLIIMRNGTSIDTISGNVSEKTQTFELVAGDVVYIKYSKDGSASDGADAGYFKIHSCTQTEVDTTVYISTDDIDPSCEEDVVCSRCKLTAKEALGHDFATEFAWDELHKSCTATLSCKRGCGEQVSLECTVADDISGITSTQHTASVTYNGKTYSDVLTCDNYLISFVDLDGAVLDTHYYHYGDAVIEPDHPTKSADNTYTYTFAGWDKQITNCTGTATYTATYSSTHKEYTVKFLDDDGSIISEETYHWDDRVAVPVDPTKSADNTYTYTFAGWDSEIVNCNGNVTYTATYTKEFIDYTIVFQDWNGTELSKATYHYGDTVSVPNDPQRADEDICSFTFAGWDKEVAATCNGNVVYTAVYDAHYFGFLMSGTITSFGVSDGEVKLQLMQNGAEVVSAVSTDGNYSILVPEPGTYILVVSKLNHATRNYEITVERENISLDLKIHLKGDINGDGRVNVSDVGKANAHAKKTKFLEGYEFVCADINGDGTINISDVGKINAHAKKTLPLW